MKVLYPLFIELYAFIIKAASLFNKKARLRNNGVKQTFIKLEHFKADKTIWIHCSSLGEFEQGRSLIEKIKLLKPNYKIALSFFSPSGYENRKNYEFADVVFYLPYDTKKNAKNLLLLLKPEMVFFVKYEFWHYIIDEIKKNDIPLYLISGIFRENQMFFKKQGKFFRKILLNFTHLFVQNKHSQNLLKTIHVNNVSVTGDTRFDRVYEISENSEPFQIIEKFKGNQFVFIAGSTWKKDEELIFNYINHNESQNVKCIIAPHEIEEKNILRIMNMTQKKIIRYSFAEHESIEDAEIMLIDNIGMLSSLYAYADAAYIGGGFGSGIHNTLEAAVFGIPVFFGPNYEKFKEAKEMINRKGAFSISDVHEFFSILDKLISNPVFCRETGSINAAYVQENIGSVEKILKFLGW